MEKNKEYYESLDKRTKEYKEWILTQDLEPHTPEDIVIEEKTNTGLGDVVEAITTATGIKAFMTYLNGGEECEGCKKRKDKWNKLRFRRKPLPLNEQEYETLDTFFSKESTNRVSATENLNLTAIHNRIFKRNAEVTSCASCLRQVVADLRDIYEAYN